MLRLMQTRRLAANGVSTVLWSAAKCSLAVVLMSGCGRHPGSQTVKQESEPTTPAVVSRPPPKPAEMRPVATSRPRIARLPPPEYTSVSTPPLIESLPPIPADVLAGDQSYLPSESIQEVEVSVVELPADRIAEVVTEPSALDVGSSLSKPSPLRAFAIEEFDDDAQLAAETAVDDVLAFFPAENELSAQFKPRVQDAFTLARNGALHAARSRFEQLLLELAQSKDASQMTDRHSRALSAGLRALAESDDFIRIGNDRDASAHSLASGHQTPMMHEIDAKWTLPHEAIAMYHLYAQRKLSSAVEGEQSGSMMLFGIGKIYAQLAVRDDRPQALRNSLTLYRSAFAAHEQNHLAANEAGVLLARAGRYEQSAKLLTRAAQLGGASATHRNLAYVHSKLGDGQLAAYHTELSNRVARQEVARGQLSSERGIAWVSPAEFNRRSSTKGAQSVASRPAAPVPSVRPTESTRPATKPSTSPAPRTLWW